MHRLLLLYTKPAVPGRVKTRLAGELGEEAAAELHAAFVRDVVASLRGRHRGCEPSFSLRVLWALGDGEEPPVSLLSAEDRDVDWRRQEGADLGERLFRGLEDAAEDAPYVAAVGSDHPEIDPIQVDDAFRRLEAGADVALGPVPDGGYYLIGLRRAAVRRRLFDDVAWSTDQVLDTTVERCRELALHVSVLPPGRDVDVPADLEDLVYRLGSRAGRCPATRELLRRWGRLDKLSV